MAPADPNLDGLLRAAAQADARPAEMPFGFDTRVVALAKSQRSSATRAGSDVGALFRRVAFAAVVLTAFASSAAYWQMNENAQDAEPLSNAYAIADNAIQAEFFE